MTDTGAIVNEILQTIEPYVVEWFDSSYDKMRADLEATVKEIIEENRARPEIN